MEAKITRDVLESYVFCRYKSYLKLLLGVRLNFYEKVRLGLSHPTNKKSKQMDSDNPATQC